MSFAEIKQEIDLMTETERFELLKYLQAKRDQVNPDLTVEMERRLARVRAGNYFTEEDLQRIQAARVAEEP